VVKFFEDVSYEVESNLGNNNKPLFKTFRAFKSYLIKQPRENNTVIIENIDYDGHYKIVIDYDQVNDNELNDMIIFADCYDLNDDLQDGYNYFPADIFFEMWFDNNCFNEGEKYNRLLRFQSY